MTPAIADLPLTTHPRGQDGGNRSGMSTFSPNSDTQRGCRMSYRRRQCLVTALSMTQDNDNPLDTGRASSSCSTYSFYALLSLLPRIPSRNTAPPPSPSQTPIFKQIAHPGSPISQRNASHHYPLCPACSDLCCRNGSCLPADAADASYANHADGSGSGCDQRLSRVSVCPHSSTPIRSLEVLSFYHESTRPSGH